LLHAIKHRVQSSKAKTQSTFGLRFDAAGQLVTVQRTLLQDAEDGKFGGAFLNACTDHQSLPYM
jgi:hypothetical protein